MTQTSEPLYKLRVKLKHGEHLEVAGYKDTMQRMVYAANTTGRFSGEDVAQVYPLTPLDHTLISHDKKLMIWGAGRSGTTFLMRLLTRLNFFTGYIPYKEGSLKESKGGCEFGTQSVEYENIPKEKVYQQFKRSPFILKVLFHSYHAKRIIMHYQIPIGHIVVPVRDHREVAKSRMGENIPWEFLQPVTEDYQVLAADIMLGKTVEAAVLGDIPLTFIRFPDIVKDEDYCWKKVSPVFSNSFDIQLDRERFREEFNRLSDFSISKYSKHAVN